MFFQGKVFIHLLSQATGLWVKTLAAKPDNLSWLPRTHVVEGDSQLVQLIL